MNTRPIYSFLGTFRNRVLIEAGVAYLAYCGLGLFSRFVPAEFLLFVLYGIAFPLVWARRTRAWRAMGFTRRGLGKGLLWGVITGVAWAAYTLVVFR